MTDQKAPENNTWRGAPFKTRGDPGPGDRLGWEQRKALPDLAPCPRCQCAIVAYVWDNLWPGGFKALCKGCALDTEWFKSAPGAADAWNTRVAP